MENKTNIEVLDELHARVVELVRAMLPILAAEHGAPLGDLAVQVSASAAYDVLTLFDDSRRDAGLPYRNGSSYSWEHVPSRTAAAIEKLNERIKEGADD